MVQASLLSDPPFLPPPASPLIPNLPLLSFSFSPISLVCLCVCLSLSIAVDISMCDFLFLSLAPLAPSP